MNAPVKNVQALTRDEQLILLQTKKLAEALKALELISILGDAEWKKLRAKQAIIDIERMKKNG